VWKLSLEGGMTCQTGRHARNTGLHLLSRRSGDFAEPIPRLAAQIERAKAQVAGKAENPGLYAYFQSYTNT
jgi:radical SAM superfamily enzyme